MKSKYTSACKFFLIPVFIYAVSIGTAAAQSRGRLIVTRDPSLGQNLVVTLRIDGRTVANLMQGSRFDNPVWTGASRIVGVGHDEERLALADHAQRVSVHLDDGECTARSNIRLHGGMAASG